MKTKLLSQRRLATGLVIIGVVGFSITGTILLYDLMTVYELTGSIDQRENSEIVQQLKHIETRTRIYTAVNITSILTAIIGSVLFFTVNHQSKV